MQRNKQPTVRSTCNNAAERAKAKKERLERALVDHCDRELAKAAYYSDRKAARKARKTAAAA